MRRRSAALVDPIAAAANLHRLERDGVRGEFGFFESVDYSSRDSDGTIAAEHSAGDGGTVVQAYMSHHQGMMLVALANVLRDDVMVRRFHRDPRVQGHRAAAAGARAALHADDRATVAEEVRVPAAVAAVPVRRYRTPHTAVPHAQFLSNGTYVTVVTNGGGGSQRVPRPRGHALAARRHTDPGSQRHLPARRPSGAVWSAGYQPTAVEPDDYLVDLHLRQGDASGAATATSPPSSTSRCRPRTTSRCSGSRCVITATGIAMPST